MILNFTKTLTILAILSQSPMASAALPDLHERFDPNTKACHQVVGDFIFMMRPVIRNVESFVNNNFKSVCKGVPSETLNRLTLLPMACAKEFTKQEQSHIDELTAKIRAHTEKYSRACENIEKTTTAGVKAKRADLNAIVFAADAIQKAGATLEMHRLTDESPFWDLEEMPIK